MLPIQMIILNFWKIIKCIHLNTIVDCYWRTITEWMVRMVHRWISIIFFFFFNHSYSHLYELEHSSTGCIKTTWNKFWSLFVSSSISISLHVHRCSKSSKMNCRRFAFLWNRNHSNTFFSRLLPQTQFNIKTSTTPKTTVRAKIQVN